EGVDAVDAEAATGPHIANAAASISPTAALRVVRIINCSSIFELKEARNGSVGKRMPAALPCCLAGDGAAEETPNFTDVSIIVPDDPGGGWDQTGRAMAKVLTDEAIVKSAPVTNVGGAGGTIGLAQLRNQKDPATLMVNGLVMVGAIETNASQVRLEDTTPIARLTDEALVVVVPADSEYRT